MAKAKYVHVDQLLDEIRQVGCKLIAASPRQPAIANIVRRVLGLISDEAAENRNGNEAESEAASEPQHPTSSTSIHDAPSPPRHVRPPALSATSSFAVSHSMLNLLSADPMLDSFSTGSGASTPVGYGQSTSINALRSEIIDGIEEIMDEVAQVDDQVAGFAEHQIHPTDTVLVYQPSPTVERFLAKAAAKRRFNVFLCVDPTQKPETTAYPNLRRKLSSAKIHSIRIASSGAAAYMPRVSKVILDARAIFADGSVIADGGADIVARAAREAGKPVIVLGGVYKVSPESPADRDFGIELGDPSGLVGFADGDLVNGVDVENATTDCISAELIDVYLTNL